MRIKTISFAKVRDVLNRRALDHFVDELVILIPSLNELTFEVVDFLLEHFFTLQQQSDVFLSFFPCDQLTLFFAEYSIVMLQHFLENCEAFMKSFSINKSIPASFDDLLKTLSQKFMAELSRLKIFLKFAY
jgi:hypothetical protein